MSEWIGVKDKLPETHEAVLLHGRSCNCVAYLDTYGEWVPEGVESSYDMARVVLQIGHPTHWMPLPQPPKHNDTNTDN